MDYSDTFIEKEKIMELTILMPCLNEEKTLETCIKKAKTFLENNNINGEILIVDNGSTDNSVTIAKANKVKLIYESQKGYGAALRAGIKNAKGKYTIMGDSDDSYNFLEILPILESLRQGNDMVIGNRNRGETEKGSIKILHKYIGTPLISFIAGQKYKIKIEDFNCGLRGFNTEKVQQIQFVSTGMEFATEMIIKAKQNNLKITEIPINFYKDGRNSKSHLRPIKDGIRHMRMIIFNK